MIECVTIKNNHLFEGNPLYGQHQLRFRSIVERQKWDVPTVDDAEYDSYDNPATCYLIKRGNTGDVIGVSRLYPTNRPYMLQESFSYLVTKREMPSSADIWEGSRFCIEKNLHPEYRKEVIQEIVLAYLEFGLEHNIKQFIGVMYPAYWRNIFFRSGWDVEWLGGTHKSTEGFNIQAGAVTVSEENLMKVRKTLNIFEPVLNFGFSSKTKFAA